MFHHNKATEIGLVAQTRAMLGADKQPLPALAKRDEEAHKRYEIGPTEFLRKFTSTTEWLPFADIYKIAVQMQADIDERSLHCTLTSAVKQGWFETRKLGRSQYRRIEGEFITEPKPKGKRGTGFITFNRKVTSQNSW